MSSRMWWRGRAAAVALGTMMFAACADAEITAPVASLPAAPARLSDSLAQKVADLGFRADMIVDKGEYFLVEGDISILKSALAGPRSAPGGPRFQYHTHELVSQAKMAQGLKVDLSGIASNSAWVTAAREAMARWNWTNSKIHLVEGSPADISFHFANLGTNNYALASWPSGGNPGATIHINPTYSSISASRKLWLLVHEIGHTLGNRHSNWDDLNEEYSPEHLTRGANHIPGTPTGADANSVMTGGVGARSWNGFSSYDNTAAQYLYPLGAVYISYFQSDAAGNVSFTWGQVADASHYKVNYEYWYETWEYEPMFPEGGYYRWVSASYEVQNSPSTWYSGGPQGTGEAPYACAYYITAHYPSGKQAGYARTQDVTC